MKSCLLRNSLFNIHDQDVSVFSSFYLVLWTKKVTSLVALLELQFALFT